MDSTNNASSRLPYRYGLLLFRAWIRCRHRARDLRISFKVLAQAKGRRSLLHLLALSTVRARCPAGNVNGAQEAT
jgi:hypothetical protein